LVATHYWMENIKSLRVESVVVHVDTTVSLPGVQDYVREVCESQGWDLRILRPKEDFFSLALVKGMPTIKRRWCCYYLKLKPLYDYIKTVRQPRAFITGLRREESPRRASLSEWIWHKRGKCFNYAPIISWTGAQVEAYIRKHNLPVNPIYKLIKSSGECLCGVYASKKELRIVRGNFPDFFWQFVEIERRFKREGAAFFFHGRPCRAFDFWVQKTLDSYT